MKYACDRCGFTIRNRFKFSSHRRWCKRWDEKAKGEKKPKACVCQTCGKSCKSFQGLGKHVLVHLPEKGRPAAPKKASRGGSRLVKALARKRDKLRAKGMGYLAVADKIDLMISALRKVE